MSQETHRTRALGDKIAVIGVILSLVFVALQIKQNTSAVRAQTRQQLTDASTEFLLAVATTDLGDMYGRFLDGEAMTDREMDHVAPALVATVRNLENVFLQTRDGVIDESALLSYGWRGSRTYASDAFAAWWKTNRDRFNADFVQAFEADHGLVQ